MGVLQRFERRLGGFVEGAFARVFGGVVQPVEVAAALRREAEDKKAIVGQGRVLVPNDYVVELGDSDYERLSEYDAPLRRELAAMVDEHAVEQGWSFVGPVGVRLLRVDGLETGVFRVRSNVAQPPSAPTHTRRAGDRAEAAQAAQAPQPARPGPRAYLVIQPGRGAATGSRSDEGGEHTVPLERRVTVLGRGSDADLRLPDTGVSRMHAEIRVEGDQAELVDLRSTNGTSLNGRRIQSSPLHDGDRITVGTTSLVFSRTA